MICITSTFPHSSNQTSYHLIILDYAITIIGCNSRLKEPTYLPISKNIESYNPQSSSFMDCHPLSPAKMYLKPLIRHLKMSCSVSAMLQESTFSRQAKIFSQLSYNLIEKSLQLWQFWYFEKQYSVWTASKS